jgi:hypothetical protein
MTIKITANDKGNPPGKLAEAELHFDNNDGLLSGCKLIGFCIWERRGGSGRNVTFPARQYSVGPSTTSQPRTRSVITSSRPSGPMRKHTPRSLARLQNSLLAAATKPNTNKPSSLHTMCYLRVFFIDSVYYCFFSRRQSGSIRQDTFRTSTGGERTRSAACWRSGGGCVARRRAQHWSQAWSTSRLEEQEGHHHCRW